jgi:hypothetical protein
MLNRRTHKGKNGKYKNTYLVGQKISKHRMC